MSIPASPLSSKLALGAQYGSHPSPGKERKDGGREKDIAMNTGKFCSVSGKQPENPFNLTLSSLAKQIMHLLKDILFKHVNDI